ncbi:MAG: hypothetical protein AUK35_07920 [Zetaproteobacteria bacterium CG2_30_46_52]|nr:MAG: hypothetical protein AUK35_07920 [Zetaproteobacteria bacterium CG2_30_46_52]
MFFKRRGREVTRSFFQTAIIALYQPRLACINPHLSKQKEFRKTLRNFVYFAVLSPLGAYHVG